MLDNISQLEKVAIPTIDQMVRELQQANLDAIWQEPYSEYGSAGLKIVTLLNSTGKQDNFDYHDCIMPLPTPILDSLPAYRAFLAEGGLKIMGARLLRLEPGAFLHEHRDFVYLEPRPRYRLHLPLVTNSKAFICIPGKNIHFQRGFLWKLNPKDTPHSACNFGDRPRIHLLLDCYLNDALAALLEREFLDEKLIFPLPPLSASEKEASFTGAASLLAEFAGGNEHLCGEAEEILLKTFCRFDLCASGQFTTSYDLLFELFQFLNVPALAEREAYWQRRFLEVYPGQALLPAVAAP
jgi:hypothetical protein